MLDTRKLRWHDFKVPRKIKESNIRLMLGRSRLRFLLIGVAALLAVLFAAFYLAESEDVVNDFASQSKTLNRGLIGEPESLDHHNFSSDQAAEILRDTGEGLVAIAPDGALKPGVSESWAVSNDGLTYQFEIRGDALWSNGARITAHNFVTTYRNLVDPSFASVNANAIAMVKNANEIIAGTADVASLGVSAQDDRTLVIRLESPTAYFLQLLAHPSLYPKFYAPDSGESPATGPHISNGAYVIDSWEKTSEITLKKNSKYWDAESVFFEKVRYHIVEEGTEFNRFRAGELDITGTVDSGIFSIAKRDYPEELKVSPRLGVYYYGYNMDNPLFGENLSLRSALSLAIDRRVLVSKITGRGEEPAFSWVPPGTYNYDSQIIAELALDKDDRESQARGFYSAAGYGPHNPLKFQLRYNKSDVQERIALAVVAMWRDVLGAEVELVSEEFQVLLSNIREREEIDVFRLSWTGNYNDPQTFLELFESGHPQNLTGYRNSKFDELLRASRTEVDLAERKSMLEESERIALNDYPAIPIYFYVSKHLVNKRISGWVPNVLDIHLSQHLWATDKNH